MFIISEKFDKEIRSNYDTLVEEKSDTMPDETNIRDFAAENGDFDKRGCCRCTKLAAYAILCFIVTSFCLHYVYLPGYTPVSERTEIIVDPSHQAYELAMAAINESRTTVGAVSKRTLLVPDKNRREAIDYLDGIQEILKKRVEYSVNRISQLIKDGVQDIEIEIAQFERSLSTLLSGLVADVAADSIGNIKAYVQNVSDTADVSQLKKNITERVQDEMSLLSHKLDEMFVNQSSHLDGIVQDRVQNIADRIRTILLADRKRFRNVEGLQMAFCYNISRQNCDISKDLQNIMEAINQLRETVDNVNLLSSAFAAAEENPLMAETKCALSAELNNTKALFYSIMNTDDNFLSTTLKQFAYQKHTEMRDFVYQNYETVILSVIPAVRKVTRDLTIVKDSHWQQVTKVIRPALSDLSTPIRTKEALLTEKVAHEQHVVTQNLEFQNIYSSMEDKFQEISAKVNSFFRSKQDYEGFEQALVATMNEKLPLISTWSLQNYVPSGACPITVEFQTYLKGIMDPYLSRSSNNLHVHRA